ncbi:MBL fold metallo-hydrolase [Streptacidiphilus sp. N1-10]|uniref:MBL fold metallo-hydrolase n=1 Tax=Streptacidiphilus jeojiensis TaxID=3229225 RepID=A0ABV6XRB4_9ACTN
MRVILLGVRGSTPAPGPAFLRYGGHTSCVAVVPDGAEVPTLVLDAGTGLRDLGARLGGAEAFQGSVVLTHLHWDHVQGLPFCPAVDRKQARVDLLLPVPVGGPEPAGLLARSMSPPHFPIGPEGLLGSWRFLRSVQGPCQVEEFTVTTAGIRHKGGLTHGLRIESGGAVLAYLPDHAPARGSAVAEALADGADLLLHDGQFLAGERSLADGYGHATVPDAVAFAARCGVRRLVLTHHAPTRTDDQLDLLRAELDDLRCGGGRVELARQGDTLTVKAT